MANLIRCRIVMKGHKVAIYVIICIYKISIHTRNSRLVGMVGIYKDMKIWQVFTRI